jgi:hypothetical protein
MLALIISLLLSTQVMAFDHNEPDKEKHVQASAAINTAVYAVARYNDVGRVESFLLAATTTIIIGIAKEMTDPVYDKNDIDADGLGILLTLPILMF